MKHGGGMYLHLYLVHAYYLYFVDACIFVSGGTFVFVFGGCTFCVCLLYCVSVGGCQSLIDEMLCRQSGSYFH